MSKKKSFILLMACIILAGTKSRTVNAAVDYNVQIVTTNVRMVKTPEDGAEYLCTIKAGEKVFNYGIDFDEGNSDYDHAYRIKTRQHGYVNHHLW